MEVEARVWRLRRVWRSARVRAGGVKPGAGGGLEAHSERESWVRACSAQHLTPVPLHRVIERVQHPVVDSRVSLALTEAAGKDCPVIKLSRVCTLDSGRCRWEVDGSDRSMPQCASTCVACVVLQRVMSDLSDGPWPCCGPQPLRCERSMIF